MLHELFRAGLFQDGQRFFADSHSRSFFVVGTVCRLQAVPLVIVGCYSCGKHEHLSHWTEKRSQLASWLLVLYSTFDSIILIRSSANSRASNLFSNPPKQSKQKNRLL